MRQQLCGPRRVSLALEDLPRCCGDTRIAALNERLGREPASQGGVLVGKTIRHRVRFERSLTGDLERVTRHALSRPCDSGKCGAGHPQTYVRGARWTCSDARDERGHGYDVARGGRCAGARDARGVTMPEIVVRDLERRTLRRESVAPVLRSSEHQSTLRVDPAA